MYRNYATAPVTSLPKVHFTCAEVLTFGRGIIKTHGWLHTPTGVDGHGYATKADAVKGARQYLAALRAEQKAEAR